MTCSSSRPNIILYTADEEMNYEIPDLAVKYNDLLGLGKMSNLGIDENYFLANTGSSAEMKEKKSDNTVGTVEVQSIHEISYIQTAEDIRTKLVSSCSENISVTGEPYDVPKNLSQLCEYSTSISTWNSGEFEFEQEARVEDFFA